MNRICVDTSAYSRFMAGKSDAVEVIGTARDVGMPVIVLGELRTGFRLGTRTADNERRLTEFLANPSVRVLDVDDETAGHYAELVVDMRRRGQPVPTNDVWIAALALRDGATLVTADHHFDRMRPVRVKLLSAS